MTGREDVRDFWQEMSTGKVPSDEVVEQIDKDVF